MDQAGFTDAFRTVHPDLSYAAETITAERLSFRIDYINFKGKGLEVLGADMHRLHRGTWASDHPAVTATWRLTSRYLPPGDRDSR